MGGTATADDGPTSRERRLEEELRARDEQLRQLEDIQMRQAMQASLGEVRMEVGQEVSQRPPPPPQMPPPVTPTSRQQQFTNL